MKILSKRIILSVIVVFSIAFGTTVVCYAFTLLTQKQALKEVFGSGFEISRETKKLTSSELAKIKKRLGGRLVYEQVGSKSSKVAAGKKVPFYFASKNGKKTGAAIIDVQPGKWGPVKFIIAFDLNAKVKKVRVMSYEEKRGRPIARRSFMRQYVGKTSKSHLKVGKDIVGISGATISSRAATFSVRKGLFLYEELYLKEKS